MKRYVGIDPSTLTGFFIQDEDKSIIVEKEVFYDYKKDPERMIHIAEEVLNYLNRDTDIICIENFSYNSKGSSQSYQYGLGYVIRVYLMNAGFEYYEVAPGGVKKFATGNGQANKKVMVNPILKRWGYKHPSDNITDAFILSEIAKAIDKGRDYEGLKEHEKNVIRTVLTGDLNSKKELKETEIPAWMKPRSKYYYKRKVWKVGQE